MTAWIPLQVQEEAELTSFAKNPMYLYLFAFIGFLFTAWWLSLEDWLKKFTFISANSEFTQC